MMFNGQDLRRMLLLRKDTCVDQGIETAGESVQRVMIIKNQLTIMEALRYLLKENDGDTELTYTPPVENENEEATDQRTLGQ